MDALQRPPIAESIGRRPRNVRVNPECPRKPSKLSKNRQPCPLSASRSLVSPRALVVRSVVSPRQPIAAACRCIDLMQAASLRAKLTAITAAEVFEMQDKGPQILRIAGELVLRL